MSSARVRFTCDRKLKWEAACAGTSARKEKSSGEADRSSRRDGAAAGDAGLRVLESAGDEVPREREAAGEAEKETFRSGVSWVGYSFEEEKTVALK
jgi:hypothetical protein